jgi:hypothetical protein
MPDDLDPPKSDRWDLVHAGKRGLYGAVPVAGPIVQAFYNEVLQSPREVRMGNWMTVVATELRQLRDAGFVTFDELRDSEVFQSTIAKATQTAATTHDTTKRELLRNALLNVALRRSPAEDLRQLFLRFLDEFTASHIVVLRFLQDTERGAKERGTSPRQVMATSNIREITQGILTEFDDQPHLLLVIQSDLFDRQLIGDSVASSHVKFTGTFHNFTSPLGEKFLEFVAEPPEVQSCAVAATLQ